MVKGTIIEEICNTLYAIWEEKKEEKAPDAYSSGGFLFSSKRQHITYLLEISNPNSFPKRYYQTLS